MSALSQVPQKRWEHFPHGADIGIRGFGRSREEAFEQAALAMTAVVTNPDSVRAVEEIAVACEAPDDEVLLTDWLNALVYEMATRRFLFGRFEVQIERGVLHGKAWGEKIDPERHDPSVEIKGATYTGLGVEQTPDGLWLAQCVVDV